MSFKNFFQKIEKTIDDAIFSVSVSVLVSNFAGLGLEAKIEIETGLGLGLGLGKISRSRSRSWSRTSRSRLQPWILFIKFPWLADNEGTFRSSSHAATCPPV